jgi:hypothetical protein
MRVFQPTTRANANQCKSPTTVMRSALPRLPCVAGVAPFRRSSNRVSGGSSWLHPQLFSARWRFWGKITARTDGQTMMREQESGPSKQTIFPSFDSTRLDSSNVARQTLRSHQCQTSNPLASAYVPTVRLATKSGKDTPCAQQRDKKWTKRTVVCKRHPSSFLHDPASYPIQSPSYQSIIVRDLSEQALGSLSAYIYICTYT